MLSTRTNKTEVPWKRMGMVMPRIQPEMEFTTFLTAKKRWRRKMPKIHTEANLFSTGCSHQKKIKALTDNKDIEGLRAMSHHLFTHRNAFDEFDYGAGNEQGINGACPAEPLHKFIDSGDETEERSEDYDNEDEADDDWGADDANNDGKVNDDHETNKGNEKESDGSDESMATIESEEVDNKMEIGTMPRYDSETLARLLKRRSTVVNDTSKSAFDWKSFGEDAVICYNVW
jgi:hypothetical protein